MANVVQLAQARAQLGCTNSPCSASLLSTALAQVVAQLPCHNIVETGPDRLSAVCHGAFCVTPNSWSATAGADSSTRHITIALLGITVLTPCHNALPPPLLCWPLTRRQLGQCEHTAQLKRVATTGVLLVHATHPTATTLHNSTTHHHHHHG